MKMSAVMNAALENQIGKMVDQLNALNTRIERTAGCHRQ